MKKLLLVLGLALLVLWLVNELPYAEAASLTPTPSPTGRVVEGQVVTATLITPQQIDELNDQADAYAAQTRAALEQSQAAINSAYGALANAQAGLAAAQQTAQYEHAARLAAEQGQMQQAVQSSQAALEAANTAAEVARSANDDAVQAIIAAERAQWAAAALGDELRQREATIAGLSGALRVQQEYVSRLTDYGWDKYREAMVGWVVAGLLGFVLIAIICAGLIILALERRNRWPRLKGVKSALITPIETE